MLRSWLLAAEESEISDLSRDRFEPSRALKIHHTSVALQYVIIVYCVCRISTSSQWYGYRRNGVKNGQP